MISRRRHGVRFEVDSALSRGHTCWTARLSAAKRALSAYYATGGDELPTSAKVQELRGLNYAVLRRGSKVVACYRVRNDGKLKRMIRIPPGI